MGSDLGSSIFEQSLLTPASAARRRKAIVQSFSLLAHVGVAAILYTMQFGANLTMTPERLRHVTLLFPGFQQPSPEARVRPPVRPNAASPPPLERAPLLPEKPLPKPLVQELPPEPPPPKLEPERVPDLTPEVARIEPPPLKTNNLGDAVAAAPAVAKETVQVAGFSAAQAGIAGGAQRSAQLGGFGAAAAVQPAQTKGLILPRGAGFSAAGTASAGGPRGVATAPGSFGAASTGAGRAASRGGVARAGGFAQAAAAAPIEPPRQVPIAKGGFEETVVVKPTPKAEIEPVSLPATATPVQILSKPRPAYSEDARRLKIEGEVQLEVVFSASGTVRVVRLIHGLGHGLDENALAAAQAIRFRPAERGGTPIDSNAIVHILFQLAY